MELASEGACIVIGAVICVAESYVFALLCRVAMVFFVFFSFLRLSLSLAFFTFSENYNINC
jgi:hypothetical protein